MNSALSSSSLTLDESSTPFLRESSQVNKQYKSSFDQGEVLGGEGLSANITKVALNIFSSAFGIMRWFISLRWYVILFIIVFGSFLFMQVESAFEIRRKTPKSNKEGMYNNNAREDMKIEKIKGILRQTDADYYMTTPLDSNEKKEEDKTLLPIAQKHVSFSKSQEKIEYESFAGEDYSSSGINNLQLRFNETITRIYKLWIMPWMYALFRHIGFV